MSTWPKRPLSRFSWSDLILFHYMTSIYKPLTLLAFNITVITLSNQAPIALFTTLLSLFALLWPLTSLSLPQTALLHLTFPTLAVERSPVRNIQVFNPTTNTLNVRWEAATGPVQQYRVVYAPLTGTRPSESVSFLVMCGSSVPTQTIMNYYRGWLRGWTHLGQATIHFWSTSAPCHVSLITVNG